MNDKIFKLELSMAEVNLVLGCLGKQPYESVFTVVSNIQKQAQEQVTPEDIEKARQSQQED